MKKFMICKHCGNLVDMVNDAGVKILCCGEPMQVLEPNTVDAAQEKHLPVASIEGDLVRVQVGSVEHPMLEEHLIPWIYLETAQGGQRKVLHAGDAPKVEFRLCDGDKPMAVYAYCNLHGLWKIDL